MSSDRRGRVADAVMAAALVAVPLFSSSAFVDQYTTAKWYLLHALAAIWLLLEVWIGGGARWPAFVREQRLAVGALAALAAWSAFRGGPERALGPLADRTAGAILVLCAAWAFARNGGRTRAIAAGLAVSAAVTIAVGLAQASGYPLPAALAAAEGPAAFFGNVNMAAQFVGLALLLVVATKAEGRRRAAWNALRVALAAGGALYLYLLASRSVLLALAAAAFALPGSGRKRALALGAAGVLAVLLVLAWYPPWPPRDASLAAHKASSIGLRLALWSDTVGMIRDQPLGVGAANFEHAFLPYQARGRLEPQEALVFRSPHDEYLRLLAEDGVAFGALAAVLAALLVRRWRASPAPPDGLRTLVVGWGTFLAVEAVFQFPLQMAFGALAASLTLGAALAAIDRPTAPPPSRRAWWRAGGTLLSLALLAASGRIARSEALYVRGPDDLASQRRACALDPRNLPACVTAAWLEVREGDAAGAKARLGDVLAFAPQYPPALKLRGEIAALEGDRAEACRRLREYDDLFRGRSSVHGAAADACAR